METLKTTSIDMDKVRQLFDELYDFLMDNRGTQDYLTNRIDLVDGIFKLTQEVIEMMYLTEIQYLREVSKEEAIEVINTYKNCQNYLREIQKRTDILQS